MLLCAESSQCQKGSCQSATCALVEPLWEEKVVKSCQRPEEQGVEPRGSLLASFLGVIGGSAHNLLHYSGGISDTTRFSSVF